MGHRLRKIQIVLVIMILVTAFLPFQSARAENGGSAGNSPQELQAHGWVCWYRFNQYAFCMNPAFDPAFPNINPLPTAISNKIFKVSDMTFANPVYLGTSIYLREDLYVGQPCPANSTPDWMLMIGGRYYNCRHFE